MSGISCLTGTTRRKNSVQKKCSRCGIKKALNNDNFYRDVLRTSGWHPWCIKCVNKYNNAANSSPEKKAKNRRRANQWYEKNREHAANTGYFKRYGLTIKDVRRMKRRQKNLCAICKKFRRLCVDHCHKTGKTRELLCRGCNGFLGMLENNPSLLKSFERYIRRHR